MADAEFSLEGKRVYVAGHRGMVGGAIVRRLAREGCAAILTADRRELDLTNQAQVNVWFDKNRPEVVLHAAAKVGGIHANNTMRAEFIYDNVMVAANVIQAAHACDVQKLLFLGSSCIYPKFAKQPITEDQLLHGPLEPTNEPYAIAKITGLKMAEAYRDQYGRDFISAMPTNLYGPGDNYHPENSHVIAALIRRFHEAKLAGAKDVVVWGTGTPRREFLFVDDLADACAALVKTYSSGEPVNIGCGEDLSIAELARLVAATVGFEGALKFDTTKPDGTPRKVLDVGRMKAHGWQAATDLESGLKIAYQDFLQNHATP